jgi:hypothetical protein
VELHPNPEFARIAEVWALELAQGLGITYSGLLWMKVAKITPDTTPINEWFLENMRTDCEIGGFTAHDCPDRPYIRCDRSETDVLASIAHELRHLHQDNRGCDWRADHCDEAEKDASEFEQSEFVTSRIAQLWPSAKATGT